MTHRFAIPRLFRSPRVAAAAGALTLATATAAMVLPATTASAHGSGASPGSRTYLCFQDAHWAGGDLDARNPACKQAIAEGGKQPLWDWPGVGNSSTKGRTRGFIPDGKICSANNKTYAAYDAPRADWPATHLTSGSKWNYRFPSHDGHPGTFYLYMTKDSYDPTKTLTWNDIEEEPFDTEKLESPNASGPDGREFAWDITLPAKKSGRHILLAFWQRSDADGSFFSCSDVVFDGGKGEISGYPNSNEWKGTEPTTPPSTPAGTPASTGASTGESTGASTSPVPTEPVQPTGTNQPPDSSDCTVQVNQVTWPAVHMTTLTLLNGTKPVDGWKVAFNAGSGPLLGTFNAGVTASGSSFTATAPDWNTLLEAGEEVSFGYVQEGSPSPDPNTVKLNGAACTVTGVSTQPAEGTSPTIPGSTTPGSTTSAPPTTAAPKPRGDMFSETFEDGLFTDWSGAGGSWSVTKGSWTIANVLQQSNAKTPMTQKVTGLKAWSNYLVEAHLRAADCTKKGGAIGIAARVNGNSSARLTLIPGYGGQLQIVRNGKVKVVSSVPFDMRLKQWRIVRLEVKGSTVTATIDGTIIGTATGVPATGKVGLITQYASASFDNIDVFSRP